MERRPFFNAETWRLFSPVTAGRKGPRDYRQGGHYIPARARKTLCRSPKITNFVGVRFEKMINPFRHPERWLDPQAIENAGYIMIRSGPQCSGTRVRDEMVADRLQTLFEERWARGHPLLMADWVSSPQADPIFPEG
jgi:hypothetical protein